MSILISNVAFSIHVSCGCRIAARPECEFLVFEAVPPFRGVRVRSDQPILTRDGEQQARQDIAARYLGEELGRRFAAERTSAGVLLRLPAIHATARDLKAILPLSTTPVRSPRVRD